MLIKKNIRQLHEAYFNASVKAYVKSFPSCVLVKKDKRKCGLVKRDKRKLIKPQPMSQPRGLPYLLDFETI